MVFIINRFKNFKLAHKIILVNCFIIILTMIITGVVLLDNVYNASVNEAEKHAILEAQIATAKIDKRFQAIHYELLDLRETMLYARKNKLLTRDNIIELFKKMLTNRQDVLGYYTLWEPNQFDGKDKEYANTQYHDKTGRFLPYVVRPENKKISVEAIKYYNTPGIGDFYVLPKKTKKITLTEPYTYPVLSAGGKDIYMASYSMPILDENNKFLGIVGMDTKIDYLQNIVKSIKPLEGYSFLLSDKGKYIAHALRPEFILKDVRLHNKLLKEIVYYKDKPGIKIFFDNSIVINKEVLRVVIPIKIKDVHTYWFLVVNIPKDKIFSNYYFYFEIILIAILLSTIVMILLNIYFVSNIVSKRLYNIVQILNKISGGHFNIEIPEPEEKDEIGQLQLSAISLRNDLSNLVSNLRKKTEELDYTKRMLEATLDQSNAGIVIAEPPDIKIIYANSIMLQYRGKTDKNLLDIPASEHPKNWQVYYPDGSLYKPEELPLTQAIITGKEIKNVEIIIKTDEGKEQWFIVNAAPVKNNDGQIQSGIIVLIDITEKKMLEQALQLERDNLEKKVDEKTKELKESLEYLEKANRHKNNFLSTMSHELRTPLNAIIGFTGLLNEKYYGTLNEKQKEYVTLILDSSEHLLKLINDILDINRIDSGSVILEKSKINVKDFINDIKSLMINQYNAKNITLNTFVTETPESIEIDVLRMKQVILNLLSNSLKFTPEGGTVDILAENYSGNKIIFTVRDTGLGIEKDDLEKIFGEFYQTNKARDQALGGTGIGLAIAYRLVNLHHGKIIVESEPDKGTQFNVIIPI